MGYYEGQRENPCPRCGKTVATVFISVAPMAFYQRCQGCNATEFTEAEERQLGRNTEAIAVPATEGSARDGG